jgi:hypothetical protein
MNYWALPIATLLIAGASLVVTMFLGARALSRSASAEYVEQLEKRVTECENDRARLRLDVGDLRRELAAVREHEHDLRREIAALRENEHRLLTRLLDRGDQL